MARSSEVGGTMLSSSNVRVTTATATAAPREDNEIDPRCRIVVVSSSKETAKGFVERVISLSDSMNSKTTAGGTTGNESGDEACLSKPTEDKERQDKGEDVVVIPHTLRNRYYEADVWFWVVGIEEVKRELLGDVEEREEDGGFGKFDAGDGVFDSDEEEEEMQKGENGRDKGTKMTSAPAIVYVWDDVVGMERCRKEIGELVLGMKRRGWLGDEGAEVCLAVRMGGSGGEGEGEVDVDVDGMFMDHGFEYVDGREKETEEDVPRLPRVLDALSTVMWASMRSNTKDARRGKQGKSRAEEEEERDGIMRELLDVVVRRDDDDEEEEFGEMVSSPVDIDMLSPFGFGQEGGAGVRRKVSMGFEDDFVQFGGYVALEEESDALPSQEEIEQTASRIFGGSGEVDLSSVFLSLQGLKGEIAAMEDSEAKRRMAARVALGLAYGLDVE